MTPDPEDPDRRGDARSTADGGSADRPGCGGLRNADRLHARMCPEEVKEDVEVVSSVKSFIDMNQ